MYHMTFFYRKKMTQLKFYKREWPNFCGGEILYNFHTTALLPGTYDTAMNAASAKEAARIIVEQSLRRGSLIMADKVGGTGHKYIISKLPRKWEKDGWIYKTNRQYYINPVHNSRVCHASITKTKKMP